MDKEVETIDSLKDKIRYAKQKIKRIEEEKIPEVEAKYLDKKNNLYYKADMAILKADIANLKMTIAISEDKIKQLEKKGSQNQPQR